MSDIQRWHPADDYIYENHDCKSFCEEKADGDYVKYDDHIAELLRLGDIIGDRDRLLGEAMVKKAELQARIDELENQILGQQSIIDVQGKMLNGVSANKLEKGNE